MQGFTGNDVFGNDIAAKLYNAAGKAMRVTFAATGRPHNRSEEAPKEP